jgi:hypothetical protein
VSLYESPAFLFPILLVCLNRLTGVEAFKSQRFEFLLGLLVISGNSLDISLNRQALSFRSGSMPERRRSADLPTNGGFPVRIDLTGQGTFQIFFDKLGNPTGANVLEHSSGTLSANGIELRFSSSDNKFYDFGTNTLAEVGLVSRYSGPAVGVVLMDRGRLIWNIDNTGEMVGPPRFEAGPHPELHGDFGGLCAALTH